jgi:very-short-patch-repair endonuclease
MFLYCSFMSASQKSVSWAHRAHGAAAQLPPPAGSTPIDRARRLRRLAGDAARTFWSRARNRQLGGFKFRLADFVCVAARLVVEIDGDQHAEAESYDAARTRYLERLGYAVIRIPTHEVLHDISQVLDRVHRALEERMLQLRCR